MAASKIIVSENIEVPVVDGKIQCIRCKGWKLPGEMHFKDRTCQACYEAIRARNRDKPKPKKNNSKIVKKNAMGWVERVEKPEQIVNDRELAQILSLEQAADKGILPETITGDGFTVSETDNQLTDDGSPKPIARGGFTVSETTYNPTDRANRLPEKLSDCRDGFTVSETDNQLTDNGSPKPITEGGFTVSETINHPSDIVIGEHEGIDGFTVSETDNQLTDNGSPKPITEGGFTVSETVLLKRIADLEKHCEAQAGLLAKALRRIAALEEKTVPVIEKEDVKRDSEGMEKLRNDLHGILKEQYEKRKINGIYVKNLYGPNGRNGGVLGVSKATAWRLREACRLDKRFRVEKADNQRGNWAIRLNLYLN